MACTECRRRQVKVSVLSPINDTQYPWTSLTADYRLTPPAVHPFRVRWPGLRAMRETQD